MIDFSAFADEFEKIATKNPKKVRLLLDTLKRKAKRTVGTLPGGANPLNPGSGILGLVGRGSTGF